MSLLLEQFGQVDMMEQYTRNHWELYKLARYSLQSGWSSLALVALRNQEKSLTSVSAALWVMVVQTVALIESSLQTAAASASAGEENCGRLDLYSQQQMYIKVMGYLEVCDLSRLETMRYSLPSVHFPSLVRSECLQLMLASLQCILGRFGKLVWVPPLFRSWKSIRSTGHFI